MPYKFLSCPCSGTEKSGNVALSLFPIIYWLLMRFEATIFDLDGTLLNTLDDLADCANTALQRLDLPTHPVDAYRYFVGDGMRTLIQRVMPSSSSEKQIVECEEIFQKTYAAHWADRTCPYPGIDEMVVCLKESGLKLAILSNKPDAFTVLCVGRFFRQGLYDCVRGETAGVPKKPDPAGALIIAEKIGVRPGNILYVGDTATDMLTGKRAGMTTGGVLWGFRKREELEDNGADYIFSTPQEIVDLCRNH
jgi:phosphoglycolate phosphatase